MALVMVRAPICIVHSRRTSSAAVNKLLLPNYAILRNKTKSCILYAQHQDKTGTSELPTSNEDEDESVEKEVVTEETKQQEIGNALRDLRKEKQGPGIWNGLLEEMGVIEWPSFGKVFGTTIVVLGVIFGSSLVLLTVNFILAELSDAIFKTAETAV